MGEPKIDFHEGGRNPHVLNNDDVDTLVEMLESYRFSRRFWSGARFWVNWLLVTGGAISGLIMAYRTLTK